MANWTDDPKIHSLMTQLGKTGQTGKPTRIAYVAAKVSDIMMKVEPLVAKLRAVKKDHDELGALWEKKKDLIANKSRHTDGIKIEFEQAKADLLSQNPNADMAAFSKDLRQALEDLEEDYQEAMRTVDEVKQSIRVKGTTLRGFEDRMEIYRKQILKQMMQLKKMPARPEQKAA
jgi:chromosome segregation ATPase